MKKGFSRKQLWTTMAIVVLTLLSGLAINLLTNQEDVNKFLKDYNIKTIHLVGFVFIIGAVLIFVTFRQTKLFDSKETEALAEDIESDVKEFYKLLRKRYQKRYESKLDERFEIRLEISEDWDGNKTQTFHERYDKDAGISEAFPRLKELFQTGDGLLIVGEPGAGKTVLLLKIALNLLERTNLQEKEALPVIFNLASWNETYTSFDEWLKAMLASGNGLSKDFAARLLHEKRIILLLDGLDELARNEEKPTADRKRAGCLKSLNDYLDGEKHIICCRIDEFIEIQKNTRRDAPVSAKAEVLTLTPAEVLNALAHAQKDRDSKHHASAGNLAQMVVKDENTVLHKLICTPFYFTLALEVFYKHQPDEIDLPKTEEKLGTFLIERYVERKLNKTPNPHNFDALKTKKWLNRLAELMEKKQQISFELADLQPTDLSNKLLFPVVSSLVIGLVSGLVSGLVFGMFSGLVGGLVGSLVGGLVGGFEEIKTEDIVKMDFSFEHLKRSFFLGLVFGLVVGLVFGLVFGLVVGLVFGLVGGLFVGVYNIRKVKPIADIQKPYQRLLGGFATNLIIAIFLFAMIGLLVVSLNYLPLAEITGDIRLKNFFTYLSTLFIMPLFVLVYSPIARHIYLRFCLWYEGVLPLRYASFLDYAAETRILEKDGGHWRFRHQNLQKYFADLETSEL